MKMVIFHSYVNVYQRVTQPAAAHCPFRFGGASFSSEVVEIQYVDHPPSMQTYLARREELKA